MVTTDGEQEKPEEPIFISERETKMSSAANLYHSVISDVISSIRDSFLDEAVDENVLVELKQLWDGHTTSFSFLLRLTSKFNTIIC